jgi:DNA-binding NtrC family response regulator
MRGIATVIEQVADSDVTVLIRGESGVGKELVSRAIHQRSNRRNRPFVKVNCAALPPSCSRASCSATSAGRSPGPPRRGSASSSRPTAAR